MRILFLGDIVGRAGRDLLVEELPRLKQAIQPDAVIVNGENAAAGFGITHKIATQLFEAGVDVLTGGNHTFDQKDIVSVIGQEKRLLRPINYPEGTPGHGAVMLTLTGGTRLLVISVQGRDFMQALDDPFRGVDKVLTANRLGDQVDAIFVDFHAEATAEKMTFGHYMDGRVSVVVGTHTHIPTSDLQILDGGTAYQTDAGMCGDYNSVIGMQKEEPIRRALERRNGGRFMPAKGDGTLCGLVVDTRTDTGLACRAGALVIGARLKTEWPRFIDRPDWLDG